jgi:hypothetical protein
MRFPWLAWAMTTMGCATSHQPTFTPSALACACASDADCVIRNQHDCCQCGADEPFADSRRDAAAFEERCSAVDCLAIACSNPNVEPREQFVAVCANNLCERRRRDP